MCSRSNRRKGGRWSLPSQAAARERGLETLQADAATLRRKHIEPSRQTLTRHKPNADS
jgi:hypothetical protein